MHRSIRPPLYSSLLITTALANAAASPPDADRTHVQFVVLTPNVRADQPQRIYLASSAYDWRPDAQPLPRVAPGLYSTTLEFEAGINLEYKFTRTGTWTTVEKAASGSEIPNRSAVIGPTSEELVLVHHVASWADRPVAHRRRVLFPAPTSVPSQRENTLTGDIRFHRGFQAPQLGNERTIAVYLPPGYADHPEQRCAVLYMHDGNNILDTATSAAGVEWRADETAARLIHAGQISELIIVGIYNNADRMHEYTPWHDAEFDAGGRGDQYLAFIVETLKPFIDRTYRTHPDRAHTGLAGSSLGGLISLYAACEHPEVFGRAGVISPALTWADRAALDYVRAHPPSRPVKIWICTGTQEGQKTSADGVTQYVRDCRQLVEILTRQGYQPEIDFHYEEVVGGRHHERDWAARFDRVLRFLFGRDRPPTDRATE